ncbi:UDP-N-acetylglucosamine acyltransferase [Microbacterium sp. QXD-8]|uniref:UDP-N-acetylglucosamine acyltransferase n=1 Tax=Microbacterium psychrotolerans TaxID=3068321 RepID=A0ABU0Z2E4_9MICO|nr:UDP-N-acetylglucosamine acyltransferase [Microbacterium sp. QXD-8]MDQ7878757.1 UDP-N-acetylglucosamine acyltransferase [Microbacterium sp. QXD-8]
MNDIHPTAVIGDRVRLGRGNAIGPFAVLMGDVEIGDDNWIGAGVVIGAPPEVRSFEHPRKPGDAMGHGVVVGSANVIRESAQIHGGLFAPTRVGDGCFLMNQVYVAHDGDVGDAVTMASSVLLAGHVHVGAGANLGLGAKVHQFRSIGAVAMVGMGSIVTRDVPPFAMVYGAPARVRGANRVGLERRGVSAAAVDLIDTAYRTSSEHDLARVKLPAEVARLLAAASA